MKIMKKVRQERKDEETRSWKKFVEEEAGDTMTSQSLYFRNNKLHEIPVDFETTVYFIQEQERVMKVEEQERLQKKLREMEEKRRLICSSVHEF